MMSTSALLKLTSEKVVEPKMPTMRSVFSGNNLSSNHNNKNITNNSKMVKQHSKTREELTKMKVKELKALVKKHNLHNQIKRYTTMRKAALIDALVSHSSAKDSSPAAPPSKGEPSLKRMRGRPKKKVVPDMPEKKPKKPKAKVRKNPPLYSKEEGGLLKGATADFEKRYGKMATSQQPSKKPSLVVEGKRKRGRPKRFT